MKDDYDKKWNRRRTKILFFAGLLGVFIYLGTVAVAGAEFHVEFLLAFLAMMGVSIAQGVDRK